MSGPACPMYSVDAESNSSSVGSRVTATVCWPAAHRSCSRTPSRTTRRLSRLYLRGRHGTENAASTLDADGCLLTSVYSKLTFMAVADVGVTCTPSCTTCGHASVLTSGGQVWLKIVLPPPRKRVVYRTPWTVHVLFAVRGSSETAHAGGTTRNFSRGGGSILVTTKTT